MFEEFLYPLPPDDEVRIAALDALDVVDTPPDADLDRIVQIAAQFFSVPIALVSLVHRDRQFFKGTVGLSVCETGRDVSFCAHAMLGDGVMVVPDARQDRRFAKNPLVTGDPFVRFYAGAPLIAKSGHALGALCLIDREPRAGLSEKGRELLAQLAALVVERLEMRKLERDGKRDQERAGMLLRHLAYHDPLTGLLNRAGFHEAVIAAQGVPETSTLLLLDLDRFKSVNDTFGHASGDQLLTQVADRIRDVAGSENDAARLGGDEFALLVHSDIEAASNVAEKIVAAVRQPFQLDTVTLVIGCSIGVYNLEDDAAQPSDLLKRADLALYDAKRNGGGITARYHSGMLEAAERRSRIEADLDVAIREAHFRLVYQPIMRLCDDQIAGYEALIRWHHPTAGIVSPATFIPIAEQTGQIVAIGEWVLREACRIAVAWPAHQRVAVNVSPVQFRSPLLLSHITAALAASGLPAQRLEIELTETAMVEDGERIAHILASLRLLGVTVAMDDFGTGYSSLSHLRDFPLDRVKIDRSFVSTAETDPHSMAVLRGIVQISHDLGARLVGEGVETEAQLALLRSLGCDCAQGYLIGRPSEMRQDASSRLPLNGDDADFAAWVERGKFIAF